jgi:hypothetical protein
MIPEIYCKDKCFWTEVRTWNIFLKVPQETKAHTKPQPSKNMKKTIQLLVALAIGISGQANAQTIAIGVIGDFETGSNDFGSFWTAGSFTAYNHAWGGVADQTPPLANGGQFYAYTPGEFGQIGKTMGTLQAYTNYTLSLDYQGLYESGDRPYIELTGYDGVSEVVFAEGYAGPASDNAWSTGSLSLSAAAISANYPTWVGQQFNVKISGAAIAVDNVTLTAVRTIVIGDFETGPNDFGSFWKAGSFEAYDHSWGGVADQTPPLANGGQFYAYTPGEFGQIGRTMGTLQANTNYTLSLDYQGIYGWGDRPYIELTGYDGVSEIVFAAGYAGPASNDAWRTGSLSLSAAAISPAWIGQQFNVKISGAAIAVDNVTLTAVPTYASWATDNAGSQAANLDWDNDGVSNGVEFFMNVAPGFTANPGLVGNTVTWTNGGNIPSSAYGSQFVVQTSANLVNWLDVPGTGDANLANTSGSVSYTVTGSEKQFVRLKVTPN